VPVGSADTVAARITASDHHHVLGRSPELAHRRVARHAPVLQWQELHREVHAVEIAPRDRQIRGCSAPPESTTASNSARIFSGATVSTAQSVTPFRGGTCRRRHRYGTVTPSASILIDPAVDQPLLHLEIGIP